MALKRVIPCLDVDRGRVVKGVNFVDIRDAGDPVELAMFYDAAGADEIVFLDITASHEKRETIVDLARRTADNIFIPFTIGGGVRSVEDARAVLGAGAEKVAINSAALARPELITELAEVFGSQCVVLAVDAKQRVAEASSEAADHPADMATRLGSQPDGSGREAEQSSDLSWDVYVHGGRKIVEGVDAVSWIKRGVELGAGEILLTSMDRDGTNNGYDIALTRAVSDAVNVPVIASGGAGELDHLVEAIRDGHAEAVLCASIFHFGEYTVAEAKERLAQAGLPVRPVPHAGPA